MKKRLLFILCSIFIAVSFASAQTARKTVTNADLEKFRQKRLAAEKDYRDNYERRGFPSPEELEKQREKDRKDLSERSIRIERENYDREQRQRTDDYLRYQNRVLYNYNNQGAYNGNGYYSPYFGYSGYGYSGGYFYNNQYQNNGRFGRGGGYYNPIIPGTVFPSRGGIRINNSGIGISVTSGGGGFSNGIRSPR